MESIFRQLRSFRLGYTEERPYPWKWTTPIVLGAFLIISMFLAALNVPLSAYNIVQEFTYRPNDTLPAVALSSLVPSVFQQSTNSFTPQLLTVGDVIKLNGSLFDYTIVDAFNGLDEDEPVSSFLYSNNPFSDGCDVTNVTINVGLSRDKVIYFWRPQYETLVGITCRVPTLFHLVWTGALPTVPAAGIWGLENIASFMLDDFSPLFSEWPGYYNATVVNITVTAHACCICDTAGAPETTTLLEPPCSSAPPRFMVTEANFKFKQPNDIPRAAASQEPPLVSTEALEKLAGQLQNVSTPDFTSTFQNVFQAIYHRVRLDLGVSLDNQIYNSPEMFNLSIMLVNVPPGEVSWANEFRRATSNSTIMAQWRQSVGFYKNSIRVPVMDYLRPVPHLKPLGSAITSVFVSTFAMLSALWTIFSLGAGTLARRTAPARQQLSMHADLEETISGKSDFGWDMGTSSSSAFHNEPAPTHSRLELLEDDMGGMKHDMREMKCMMRLLLEKQGLPDDTLDHDLKANLNVKDGILSPLVHRRSSSSDRA